VLQSLVGALALFVLAAAFALSQTVPVTDILWRLVEARRTSIVFDGVTEQRGPAFNGQIPLLGGITGGFSPVQNIRISSALVAMASSSVAVCCAVAS